MYPDPTHLSHPFLSTLHPCSLHTKEKHQNDRKKLNIKTKNNLPMEVRCVVVCHPVGPFAQTASLAKAHCQESLFLFQASGFCYTKQYWIFTRTSLGYLVGFLCHRTSTGLVPSHASAFLIWGRCVGRPIQSPGSGPRW